MPALATLYYCQHYFGRRRWACSRTSMNDADMMMQMPMIAAAICAMADDDSQMTPAMQSILLLNIYNYYGEAF